MKHNILEQVYLGTNGSHDIISSDLDVDIKQGNNMSESLEIQIEIEGVEFDARVEFDYDPGFPGNTSGPMESCYPPEPEEWEPTKLEIFNDDEWHDATFLIRRTEEQLIELIQTAQLDSAEE